MIAASLVEHDAHCMAFCELGESPATPHNPHRRRFFIFSRNPLRPFFAASRTVAYLHAYVPPKRSPLAANAAVVTPRGGGRGGIAVFPVSTGGEATVPWAFIQDAVLQPDYPGYICPAAIVHGVNDEVVPVESTRALVEGR